MTRRKPQRHPDDHLHPIFRRSRTQRVTDCLHEIASGSFALYGTIVFLAVPVMIVLLIIDVLGLLYSALLAAGFVALLLISAGLALRD